MSNATAELLPLEKKLRKKLETAVKDAREVVEQAARAACTQLGVGNAEPDTHLSEDERELRRRLRIHGRQLGDERDASKKTQQIDRLVEEIGYQHWHRMLFARFLAENQLLMYPDPDSPVPVTIQDCDDLADEEGAKNGWELAARYAAKMLPQIFRVDSPVFSLELPPEKQLQLEKILSDLPTEVFTASDSLGWVYQFWQAKRKDEVNASEVKIGARELPAVTQLFTEPYMVSFLLDNSLGAWWAGKRLTEDDLRTATSEQELRDKLALPGVPLEYLRFVRSTDPDVSGKALAAGSSDSEDTTPEPTGPWTPAAGTFDAWPESLSELKTLDPCCGSGHFLVAALLMLTPMRMELEGLSAKDAVDRVLSENLHGLEIDQRCVELAAFALALAAWRFPDAGGYRVLPDLNVACCGLSVSVAKDEWKELAKGNNQLKIALDWMYDEFKDAPILGSLLNPAKSMAARVVKWDELSPLIQQALDVEKGEEKREVAVVAHGLAKAAVLLGAGYDWIITNVPYLGKSRQDETLQTHCDANHKAAKSDLATAFMDRCIQFAKPDGILSLVLPQSWLFQSTFKKLRKVYLEKYSIVGVAQLGPGAFETIGGEVVQAILFSLCKSYPALTIEDGSMTEYMASDPSVKKLADDKATFLQKGSVERLTQVSQVENPGSRILVQPHSNDVNLVEVYATSYKGLCSGDNPSFQRTFWEIELPSDAWKFQQGSVETTSSFSGRESVFLWENGEGRFMSFAVERLGEDGLSAWIRGTDAWGNKGIVVRIMGELPVTTYTGDIFDNNISVIVPKEKKFLAALALYAEHPAFNEAVRTLNRKMSVTDDSFEKIPFDLSHWQKVASEKYPHGLPEPYSDDPTQWIFHGHPASSTDALQVAVARLLGYRWPAELDGEMELATDARAWVTRSSQIFDGSDNDTADDDGIVCIPAVGSEQPADERLLNLLHRAYEDGRAQEQVFRDKLDAADPKDPVTVDLWRRDWQPSLPDSFPAWRDSLLEAVGHTGKTLESWLRDKFFTQHMKGFHHRPFIWHIWDGLKDGFSVLVNYHKLDNKLLETLIYTYLNDWINKQKGSTEDGHEERLAAAESLKLKLEKILEGESPHDIFVRWKPLSEQPIGWTPDLNDGVRLNIRPWMTVGDVKKKGAGVLRDNPTANGTKTAARMSNPPHGIIWAQNTTRKWPLASTTII